MRLLSFLEALTKTGKELTFSFEDAHEENRGWVTYRLTAFLDGREAGVMQISWIPERNWKKYYPTIFNFLAQQKGWSLFEEDPTADYRRMSFPELIRFVSRVNSYVGHYAAPEKYDSREQLLTYLGTIEARLKKTYEKEVAFFKMFWIDKPMVEYVRTPEDLRGQGIASALYSQAPLELRRLGFTRLYRGLTNDHSTPIWKKFIGTGRAKHDPDGDRYYITEGRR